MPRLPVLVVGAGPVGLAAAAHLAERDVEFLVLESGDTVAASIAEWRQVRLFSPWRYDIDAAARRLLEADGWVAPDPDALPTGGELIESYLQPLAKLPTLAGRIRYGARVTTITRLGFDRVRSTGRDQAPFLVRLADGDEIVGRAVVDASGTWRTPNVLGGYGIPAHGEPDAVTDGRVISALPDVLGVDRERFAGRRTAVVGAGHSAATTLLDLAELATQVPGTEVVWVIRGGSPGRTYGGGDADQLPARGALGARVRDLVQDGTIELVTGFATSAVKPDGDRLALVATAPHQPGERRVVADRVVNATGFRPDHDIAAELRLDLDPVLGTTRALAPLIDPNQHSCGTVPAHGVDQLSHPDTGYYAVGVKSYGRAPTFLLATGYEQVRSVVAAVDGDWEAARDVRLELPETGVCSSDPAEFTRGSGAATGPGAGRGLGTGLAGGLLNLVDTTATGAPGTTTAAKPSGGCCG